MRSLRLLLGNGKGLLHFDLAAVCNDHILQGLVPTVGLGALHLPHHVLGKKAGRGAGRSQEAHCWETAPGSGLRGLRPTWDEHRNPGNQELRN